MKNRYTFFYESDLFPAACGHVALIKKMTVVQVQTYVLAFSEQGVVPRVYTR